MDYDETLIRDADLLATLARFDRGDRRGLPGSRAIVVIELIEQQQQRDAEATALAAMPREKRRRAQIRAVFENAPPSPQDVRHLHSVLAICGLPYSRQPLDVREYERRQGNMALDISAGFLRSPQGEKIAQPLPFGPKARLVLMHLCSEAVRQKSATIELADTFTAFVRDLGFADNGGRGGALTAFREQLHALAACSMRLTTWNGERVRMKRFDPIDQFELWLSVDHRQRSLWPSTVTFSAPMFESLQQRALPINVRAVRAFAGSARKLDLYFWLGYRLYNIDQPLHISWSALAEQFGQGYTRGRAFRAALVEELGHIREVFPKLPLTVTERGVTLNPAGPEVLALPAPRALKKR